jgi:hypothetical protein
LTPSYNDLFSGVVQALQMLYGSKKLYNMAINDIHEIFSDIKSVIPGTIGAYFIGCTVPSNFNGPSVCDPRCVSSLPPGEKNLGYGECDDLVLIYSEGGFNSLNEKRSPRVYIYIGDINFTGFTPDNIEQLKEAEIEKAILIYGGIDGSYREVTNEIGLADLPRSTPAVQSSSSSSSSSNNNGAAIGLAVIIIVIIIILLIVLWQSNNRG